MKTSRLALGANPCGATHPCASASPRPAQAGRSLIHLTAILCLALSCHKATAASANLAWDPNPEADIAGYKLSYGTSPGSYSTTLSTGTAASASVSGLTEGQSYYFVVKAVNTAGLESDPSAEVSYQVPPATPPPAGSLISQTGWTLRYVDSQEPPQYAASLAFDGKPDTFWHTAWIQAEAKTPPPHELQIDLGTVQPIGGFRYLPRQDSYDVGNIAQYEFYVSLDGSNWGNPVASGVFPNTSVEKEALFTSVNARYVRLRQLTEVNGETPCSVAELNLVQGSTVVTPPVPVNQVPTAANQPVSTNEDQSVAISLSASDADGNPLSYRIVSSPAMGSLSGSAPKLTYTPKADANGSDSFTFVANDGKADSNTATVSITVVAVNDAPSAASQTVSTPEDKALGILLSASDKDGDALSYRIVSGPTMGSLSGSAPNLTYTPKADANGSDSFTFVANDGKADSSTGTVSITITPVNDAPVAAAQLASTTEDKATGINLSASDKDGDPLTYRIVSNPTKGTLSGTSPNLTYTPYPNASGSDSFSFRANDGTVDSNAATVSITISPVNDAPVAAAQVISATAGAPVGIVLSASDADGDQLTFSIVGNPLQGSLSGTPPNLSYTPGADASGSDSFSFRVSDGKVDSNTAIVSITIIAPDKSSNKAPVFQTSLITLADATVGQSNKAASLAGTAIDPDGDAVVYSKSAGPDWLAVAADGTISGTPATGTEGLNAFTIRATDTDGAFSEAPLQITVQAASLPLPWSLERIGTIAADTTAASGENASSLKIKSPGSLSTAADSGTLAWQTLSGDGDIIARITSMENADSSARIGVMIRESLAPNSKHAFIGWDGNNGLRYVIRTKTGGTSSTSSAIKGIPANLWLRLVRVGSTIYVFTSVDGLNWKRIGKSSLSMSSSCYIGLMACGTPAKASTGVFQNVAVKP